MQTISDLKEQEVTETPLLLFDCEVAPGSRESWSTHSVVYEGREYKARVLRHNLFEFRSGSDDGIDAISKVSITLANADSYFSQIARNVGWKGAKLTAQFVFFNLRDGIPASEGMVLFRGIANPPDEITESSVRLTFTNRLGLQRVLLPAVRIQRRCPWTFPSNNAERQEAYDGGSKGQYSFFYSCGYSADIVGGVGNLDDGGPFTSCDCTRAHCRARGMFDNDADGNPTRRFAGIEFLPPSILVRSYGERGSHLATVLENEARYNDFAPLIYGTTWYQPPIVFARNDGNMTRMEVLLGMGEIDGVLKVVVNDIEIPEGHIGTKMTATGWFNVVSLGNRSGGFNMDYVDKAGEPIGDPYGSMAYLSVVVPNRVNDGRSLPRIQVLVKGLKLDCFGLDGGYSGEQFSNNPAWVVLDLLRRSGWGLEEIDIPSFAKTAAYCEEAIEAHDLYGNPIQIPRFQCNLLVRRRRSAADLVRGIRNGSALYLTYGPGGLLQLRAETDLTTQQPSRPESSNSIEELNGGWPAYEFGDGASEFSGLLRRENGEPSVRFWSRPASDTPNRFTVEFQDAFNEYQQDSLSLVDIEDVLRSGQEINATLSALGIPNFSQAARIIKLQLDKIIRGNLYVEFETSIRGLGLKPGDLITLSYLKEGMQRQPFRIVKVSPGLNHRTTLICGQIHDDGWYTDLSGSGEGNDVARRQPHSEVGLPRPLVGKQGDSDGGTQFEVAEETLESVDGAVTLALLVGFVAPQKPTLVGLGIPLLSLAPEIQTSGGTIPGGQTLYYAVSGVDGNGDESGLSFVVRATIPSGTSTNTVALKNLSFSAGTTNFHVYRGSNPTQLLRIASSATIANEFRDAGLPTELIGPPDENYDHANFYWRLELVPEYGATIFSASTIGNDTLQMIPNEHAGLIVRITTGKGAGQERSVLSHDASTLMVTPGWEVMPDATSSFVVAESGWHFGAAGVTSPLRLEIPNREGATVHVSGRSANVHNRECSYELSPLTRWNIGGSPGFVPDREVPPAAVFGLAPTGQGTVEVVGVSFTDLANTRTIQAATLTLHYWDELNSPTHVALGAALSESDTTLSLVSSGEAEVGSVLQIGAEILVVEEVLEGGLQYQVTRSSHGTTAESHAAQAPVYHLRRKLYVVPFVKNFFGSPASGSYSYPIFLPNARISAADLFVTNIRGNSETTRKNFTATTDFGLRTVSGGQISIQVEGYLAIESNAAPPLVIEDPHSVRDIFAVVHEAPTGGPIELELRHNGEPYCYLTIPVNAITSNIVNGFGMRPLQEKAELSLNILSVAQTPDSTPGRDLTVTIRL